MGWVSTYEDIVERLTDDIAAMKQAISVDGDNSAPFERGLAIQRTCESFLARLQAILDLATDPTFDLAAKHKMLEAEVAKLKRTVDWHVRERDAEQEKRLWAEESLNTAYEELAEWRRKAEQLAKDIQDEGPRKRRERLEKRMADQAAQLAAKDEEIRRLEIALTTRQQREQEMKDFKDDPAKFYDAFPPPLRR